MTSDPLPARMLNEWVYCPRLAMLEHLHGEWAESSDTEDGHRVHRRVDIEGGDVPAPAEVEGTEVARSLWLTSEDEGITARPDLLEGIPGTSTVRPVDYKRGSGPAEGEGVYEPERVQVCAQALVLRSHGYVVNEGAVWFAGSRRRVSIALTDDLVARTRAAVVEMRAAMERGVLPPPLVDSPKCNGCSLAPICLPDEVALLATGGAAADAAKDPDEILTRRLVPARDDGLPLHVLTQGARVELDGSELVVRLKGAELGRAPLPQTSQVGLYGNIQVTTQAMRAIVESGAPVALLSRSGWFVGLVGGLPHGNVFVRQAQLRAADNPARALAIARGIVVSKLRNQRTLLRRNADGDAEEALARLDRAIKAAGQATTVDSLRGCEGDGAAGYFGAFAQMLRPRDGTLAFDFVTRNRRPPTDPANALLSFAYAMLTREWTHVIHGVGLDPYVGFLHAPRQGRPALALDLMEEFRPILADSTAIGMVNTGEIGPEHFVRRGPSCNLTDTGRRRVLEAWERRLDTLVTHPVFGYRISYRRVFEVQTRLLARHLLGEIPDLPPFLVR